MHRILFALALAAPLPALAQVTPTPPLPPANPLPYEDADAAAVMAPINGILAAIAKRDGPGVLPFVVAGGMVSSTDGASFRRIGWTDYAEHLRPGPERLEERIFTPAIEVDGAIAMVWAPYVFRIDGKVQHCGVNHFDLVRHDGAWKVLNVTYSIRKTECEAYSQ